MPYTVYTAKREGRGIGDSIATTLKNLEAEFGFTPTVIAIVPRMLTFYANMPKRYEVTEVDLIVSLPTPGGQP